MTLKPSAYGLHPDDDLTDPQKQIALYEYWDGLKFQCINHMIKHDEVIPLSTVWITLARAFPSYPIEEIQEACYAGMDLALGVTDDDDDWEEVPDHELSEEDKAVRDDFLKFVQEHIKKKREEEALFYSLMDDPNGR